MKTAIVTSVILGMLGTASSACTSDETAALAASISAIVEDVVARDDANLGKVLAIAQAAAVTEYHAGPTAPACSRQEQTLAALTAFHRSLGAAPSASM